MMRPLPARLGLLLMVSLSAVCTAAEDSNSSATAAASKAPHLAPVTQGMTITGDKELPQVLYILPWQEQRAAMPSPPQIQDQIQQPLIPCDTDQAMVDYQADLWDCASKAVSAVR